MGGVRDTHDALDFIIAGAAALQVGTAKVDRSIWPKLLDGIAGWPRPGGHRSDNDMDELLVALDVDTIDTARAWRTPRRRRPQNRQPLRRHGPAFVEALASRGDRLSTST